MGKVPLDRITPASADNTLWVVALLWRYRIRSFGASLAVRVAAELFRYAARL